MYLLARGTLSELEQGMLNTLKFSDDLEQILNVLKEKIKENEFLKSSLNKNTIIKYEILDLNNKDDKYETIYSLKFDNSNKLLEEVNDMPNNYKKFKILD